MNGNDIYSKDNSSNIGSWKLMGEGKDSFSEKMSFREISLDENVCELLPSASSVESGVENIFVFWPFFETSFSGSDKTRAFC